MSYFITINQCHSSSSFHTTRGTQDSSGFYNNKEGRRNYYQNGQSIVQTSGMLQDLLGQYCYDLRPKHLSHENGPLEEASMNSYLTALYTRYNLAYFIFVKDKTFYVDDDDKCRVFLDCHIITTDDLHRHNFFDFIENSGLCGKVVDARKDSNIQDG